MAVAMGRLSGPPSFEPSRLRGSSRDEVQVGAYARRQRRRRVLIGAVGALLIAGALALYLQLRPPSGANRADRYPVRVRCVSCGHTATVQVPFGQTFPLECPACKEMTCRELWQCRDCGALFVPQQAGAVLRCPQCGGQRVGSAAVP